MQNYKEVKLTRRARRFGFGYVVSEPGEGVRVTPNYEGTLKEVLDTIAHDSLYSSFVLSGYPMNRAFFLNGKKILGVRYDRIMRANYIQEQFTDIYEMLRELNGRYGDNCKSLIAYVEKDAPSKYDKSYKRGKTLVEVFEEEERRANLEASRASNASE